VDSAYRFGDFTIWPSDRRLMMDGRAAPLPPKAFDALLLLVRNHGRLVSRREIVRTLWPDTHVTEANVTNLIVLLRKTLGPDAVQTVSKSGYRFTLAVTGEPGIQQVAYASFVRGKELLKERSIECVRQARDHFLFCIAEDPQFAAAWAWLGRAYRFLEKSYRETFTTPSLAEAAYRRAFLLDPDLPCAHQFYTPFQADTGKSREAIVRLAARIKKFGEDPETLAGFVQVLRYCGLLHESVAAHERVMALDPTAETSVAHTYFLLGDFPSMLANYPGRGLYLDAAAWQALGNPDRALSVLRARSAWPEMGPFALKMLTSLMAILDGRDSEARKIIAEFDTDKEPEGIFYIARHCGLLNDAAQATRMVGRARKAGFWSSYSLEHDRAFRTVRSEPEFIQEIGQARSLEADYRSLCAANLGPGFFDGSNAVHS
jgi:DNA-binding winged helix-turn-helix (wHTH) protein